MPNTDSIARNTGELSDEIKTHIIWLEGFCKKIRDTTRYKPWQNDGTVLLSALTDEELLAGKNILVPLLSEVDFTSAFTGSGIPSGSSFFDESLNIIKGKILPYLHEPNEAITIIHEIFNDRKDHDRLVALFSKYPDLTTHFSAEEKKSILTAFRTQLINATHIISYRIAALGMDEDIYTRAGKDDTLITPFMEQNREINELQFNIEQGNTEKIAEDLAQARVMLKHCMENIALIDKSAGKNGASLRQTFILRKLELLVTRLGLLLPLTCCEENTDTAFNDLFALLQQVILLETSTQKLRDFVSRNINMIAYRITENKRKTGEHYIAGDRSEYWELFISACGGGFIVSFLVILKLVIHDWHLPILWEGILYSINYATGFVLIHVLGFTLATKQPAMTAAFIAASLDDIGSDERRYQHLATTVAMLLRSQLVSFIGNLLIVFPVTLLWVFLLSLSAHKSFIGPEDAQALIAAVHPFQSLSFWYACITGVLLFLAGIISGFGDNKVMVSKIGARLEAHPFLKKRLSAKNRSALASYFEKNAGPLAGNIALGFMLGLSGFVGKITGLPIDIRHITFSTGNVAMGLYGIDFRVTAGLLLSCALGIFIIGLFNFLVSFLLALQVAVRSRGIKLRNYPDLLKAVLVYLRKSPGHFFFPPRSVPVDAEPILQKGD